MDKWDRLLIDQSGHEFPMRHSRSFLYCVWYAVFFRFINPEHSRYRGVRLRRHVEF